MTDATVVDPLRKHGPPEARYRIVPGFKRVDLARLFADRGYTSGAEIGVADGRYSEVLCQAIPNLRLRCVDAWAAYAGNVRGGPQSQHDENFLRAAERLRPYQATLVRAMSAAAVRAVPLATLDFVYIDGNHAFDYVMRDLLDWAPRVRSGGIVAGHDYYHFRNAGVVEAVNAYTTAHQIADWALCDEREPSFWWTV